MFVLSLTKANININVINIFRCSQGNGIDRHLLGLRLLNAITPQNEERKDANALFADPLFNRSTEWVLSTSHLPLRHASRSVTFRPVHPDGYGVLYMVDRSTTKLVVTTYTHSNQSKIDAFCSAVIQALADIQKVLAAANGVTSKL